MSIPNSALPKYQRGGSATPEQYAKLGGVFWWLLLGLMIASDIGSALGNVLVALGLGLTATAVGAIVGVPLAALGYAMSLFLSFNAFMFSTAYYLSHRIPLMEARKVATWGASAIIKMVPGVNILPTLTFSFVVITIMENAKRGSGVLGIVAQKALAKAGPVGAVAGKVLSA